MKKVVAYFSASGTTAEKAKALAKIAGADLKEIVPKEKYTSRDLNWMDKKSRSSLESADEDCRPAIEGGAFTLSGYDRVYIGFPICGTPRRGSSSLSSRRMISPARKYTYSPHRAEVMRPRLFQI